MTNTLKFIEKISEDLRLNFLDEINSQPSVWEEADYWARCNCQYLSKNKTCIGLISGKEYPYTNTPFYCRFPKLTHYLSGKYKMLTRINIQKINALSKYGMHIDTGDYFIGKDRFTLCLQSSYKLIVNSTTNKVNPGELIWFDNKQPHEAVNLGSQERIAIIFDVPITQ
jgi:hypothetical protein